MSLTLRVIHSITELFLKINLAFLNAAARPCSRLSLGLGMVSRGAILADFVTRLPKLGFSGADIGKPFHPGDILPGLGKSLVNNRLHLVAAWPPD
ncbi:MAG: hypothetical protein GXP06_13665 [Alphaproteobacteria bacterium]|nr:hypothetical protein [Alphaproteobacteria bacterium]